MSDTQPEFWGCPRTVAVPLFCTNYVQCYFIALHAAATPPCSEMRWLATTYLEKI